MKLDELYNKYKFLFERRYLSRNLTCFAYGIECNSGWFDLIDQMSLKLSELYPDIQYEQIKEKFGVLRVYVTGTTDDNWKEVKDCILEFENKSVTICETCGEPGEQKVIDNYYKTICVKCERGSDET